MHKTAPINAADSSQGMNILLIIDNFGAGGAQNQLSLLAVGLKRRGHRVTCFVYHPQNFFEPRLLDADIPVIRAQKRNKLGLNVILSLVHLMRRETFDIALSYLDTPNFYAAVACRLTLRAPELCVSHRFTTVMDSLGLLQSKVRLWTNRQARFVVCNSNHERKLWQSVMPRVESVTIYNGIADNASTQPRNRIASIASIVPGWALKQPVVLAVGTVTPRKQASLILDAMEILKKKNLLGFTLVWLGEEKVNMREDVSYACQLRESIRQKQLEQHWVWAGEHSETQTFYQAAQVLVHASTQEGLPNVVCEAQMAGLPVIVSDVLDHPDMIENNNNGFLFTPNNAASLAEKLETFFALSEQKRSEMREQSRQMALRLYSLDRCVDEYEELFRRALAR